VFVDGTTVESGKKVADVIGVSKSDQMLSGKSRILSFDKKRSAANHTKIAHAFTEAV
jgi:hypothetical protein